MNYSYLDSVAITERRKSDIIIEIRKVLANRLGVNADNISLCDTIIQFKPERFTNKLPTSMRIEKETLLTYITRCKYSRNYKDILFHQQLNEVDHNLDAICYKLYYSEFIDNMIYAEVESQKLNGRLKVLFMLDNKGTIKEYIIDSSVKIADY